MSIQLINQDVLKACFVYSFSNNSRVCGQNYKMYVCIRDGIDHNYTEVTFSDRPIEWERRGKPNNEARIARDIFTSDLASHPLSYQLE